MFQKLRMKFADFMYGRYGFDRFSKFLFILFIVLWVLLTVITNIFPFLWFLNILEYALFIYTYFRVFSKNISKRAAENRKYMQVEYKVKNFFRVKKSRMQKRKTLQGKSIIKMKRVSQNCNKQLTDFKRRSRVFGRGIIPQRPKTKEVQIC